MTPTQTGVDTVFCVVSSVTVEWFVHCCLLSVVKLREHPYVWLLNAFVTQYTPHAAVLNCVECLFESSHCWDPKRLMPFSGPLPELVVRREACMIERLAGVQFG